MSPIEQLKKKLKDLANQGSNVFSQKIVSPVPQRKPIQPQDNIVSQFGRSSVGKAITGFQKNIEQQTLPKVNFTKQTNTIQNPTVRTVANFGATAAQEMANLPQRLLEGGGRIGTQVVRPIQEGRPVNTRQAVGAFASAAEPILDIATLGSGIAFKQAAKQGLKAGAKYGVKRAILRGVATGAGYGAAFGGLRGLSEGREASFRKGVEGAAQGAVAGGVFGGITAGAGGLVGLIRKTPEVEKQLRDSMGRWTRGATPVKPKGMTKPQWDFQLEFNQKYKRNPYTPVYADDVKKAVSYEVEQRGAGLSMRDVSKDSNPLGTRKLKIKPQAQIQKEVGESSLLDANGKVNQKIIDAYRAWEPTTQKDKNLLNRMYGILYNNKFGGRMKTSDIRTLDEFSKRVGIKSDIISQSGQETTKKINRSVEGSNNKPSATPKPQEVQGGFREIISPYSGEKIQVPDNPDAFRRLGIPYPQSPLKSQPNVAKPLLSDISKTTSTPQHNLKMAKESGRSFEDLLKDSPEMLKGRTGFDTPPQTVKVYRGVSQEGRNIRSGDWVTTNPEYAKKYGGVVQELEVSAKDLKYMNGSAQGNAMGEFPEYIYTGKFSGQKPVSPLGLTVGESNVGSVGNTTPEILVKNPPTKEVFHNPIVPQKQFTQLGSATNTRADQIAGKYRIKDARQSTPTESVLDDIKGGFERGRKARESAQNVNNGSLSQQARSEFIDRLTPVYDFIKDGKKIGAESNPYKKMRLLAGISGKVEAYADKNVRPILTKERNRIDDLSALLTLERERELVGAKGLIRKRTAEQIEQGVNELRAKYGDEGFRTLQESSQQLRKVGEDMLVQLRDAGIIDEASYNTIKAKNQFYAPMEAVEHMADNLEKGRGTGSFNVSSQDIVQGIKDYTGDVGDPIEAFVRRIPKVIALVEKNKAIKSFVDLRKVDKDLYGDLIIPLRTAENVKKRISLFSQAKELKPMQGILGRFIKTHSHTIRKIESQVNKLEKKGLSIALKDNKFSQQPQMVSGFLKKTTPESVSFNGDEVVKYTPTQEKILRDIFVTTKNRGELSTKSFIDRIVTDQNLDIAAIKKQVATRENKLGRLFDDLQELRNAYDDIYSQRRDLIDDARLLKDLNREGMSVLNVFRDGVNEAYAVPEVIESAVKNLDAQSAGMLVKLGGWQAKTLRAGATGLNIGFIPVNIVRDVQDALTTELSENGAKSMLRFLASYPHAILSAAGKGKLYQEWAANGGLQSTMLEQIAKKTPKTVAELSGKRNLFKTVINSPISAVEFLNRVGEQSTRLARFKSGIAGGEDVTEAAFKSRDISLDFAKAGNSVKVLNQVIPFLNAGIQGSEKLARLYRTNPVAATVSTSIMYGLPTVLLYQHNSQFKDYQDVPDSEKQNNWLIIARDRTPEEIAANEKVIGIKIPKGFLGRIVSNSAESAMAFANNRDPQTFLNFGLDTLEGISPVGLPVDKERFGRTLSRIAPPALKAGIEGLTNTNLYFGSKIVPQSLENLPPSEQYREKTPGIYKAAGQMTGTSPLILENTVNSMTGGLGRQAATFFSGDVKGGTIDQVTRRFSGIQGGVNSDKAWETVEKEKQYTALRNKRLKEAYSSGNMEEFKRLSDGMSKEQIKTFITNQKKEGIKPEMSYEEKAYDTLTKEEKARLLKERPELKSSFSVVDQAGAAGNSPMIQDNMLIGKTGEIIDLTPPSKGNGIAAFANRDWNITKAREVWNSEDHTKEQKDAAFKQLGVKQEDVRYDALAHYSSGEKAQYIVSKSPDKKKLIENLTTGRVRSIGNELVANDGTIDILVDEGYLTKEEAKELKAIDYDKSGKLKIKSSGGRKLKIGSTPTMKAVSIGTPSKMAQVSFAKRSPKLQLKARPAKIKVKLKKLQAKRQKASKLKIKSLKSANV